MVREKERRRRKDTFLMTSHCNSIFVGNDRQNMSKQIFFFFIDFGMFVSFFLNLTQLNRVVIVVG